jgi:hydrogenase-4 component H
MISRIHSLIYLLPQLWRTLRTKPTTVRYPFAPLELPSCFRGRPDIDERLCRGCGLCVRDCPANALELERRSRDEFRLVLHHDRCAYCGQCAASCEFGAIRVTSEFARAEPRRDRLVRVLVDRDGDDGA